SPPPPRSGPRSSRRPGSPPPTNPATSSSTVRSSSSSSSALSASTETASAPEAPRTRAISNRPKTLKEQQRPLLLRSEARERRRKDGCLLVVDQVERRQRLLAPGEQSFESERRRSGLRHQYVDALTFQIHGFVPSRFRGVDLAVAAWNRRLAWPLGGGGLASARAGLAPA